MGDWLTMLSSGAAARACKVAPELATAHEVNPFRMVAEEGVAEVAVETKSEPHNLLLAVRSNEFEQVVDALVPQSVEEIIEVLAAVCRSAIWRQWSCSP